MVTFTIIMSLIKFIRLPINIIEIGVNIYKSMFKLMLAPIRLLIKR